MDELEPKFTIPGSTVTGPVQLETAYLFDLHVVREAVESTDEPMDPTLDPQMRTWSLSPDRTDLVVICGAEARYQYRPTAIANVDASYLGSFKSDHPLSDEEAHEFAVANGMIILWPYLRSVIAGVAADTQVPFPPMPVLAVSRLLTHVHEGLTEVKKQTRRAASRTKKPAKGRAAST